MNSKFRRIAFEMEILYNIMYVLADTFDEVNIPMKLNHTDPKLLNSSVWPKSSAPRSLFHWEGIIQAAFANWITWFIEKMWLKRTIHSWI